MSKTENVHGMPTIIKRNSCNLLRTRQKHYISARFEPGLLPAESWQRSNRVSGIFDTPEHPCLLADSKSVSLLSRIRPHCLTRYFLAGGHQWALARTTETGILMREL